MALFRAIDRREGARADCAQVRRTLTYANEQRSFICHRLLGVIRPMTENAEQRTMRHASPGTEVRCPDCAAIAKLVCRFLDSRTGKTIQVHQCKCGKLVWET